MAGSQKASGHLFFIVCVSCFSLLILLGHVLRRRQTVDSRHTRDVLDSTESPAQLIDPAAIDLTPLVNALINSSQSGSRQLFSVLSVTSYSSLALHKLTLLVYNISSIRSIENSLFRRRFCYCVTNETNDLTDFTAVLLDVVGNSTSYLHELFKSTSILSVSQRNNSDCIYICVMAGKIGRELPEFWEVGSITPLFNQTIMEGPHREWNLSHVSPSGMSSPFAGRVHSTSHATEVAAAGPPPTARQPPTDTPRGQRPTHEDTTSCRPSSPPSAGLTTTDRPGCPWRRPELSAQPASGSTEMTTVGAHKLQPCVLELCKFFSQCLCRRVDRRTRSSSRYCDDSHLWYEKHTPEVCRRVRRLSFSRSLKQRCLAKMCNKL
ncbi:uncharacterized protein hhla1 [Echeneis naucrates]|uniref:uncharacterized protein hhla1 n=1 Tax=Echeneis naucrates TaxID=173247 RepID=UPI001113CE7D|nr:HERV-H LTR-associating protein 1 [Echeneis naucrates]